MQTTDILNEQKLTKTELVFKNISKLPDNINEFKNLEEIRISNSVLGDLIIPEGVDVFKLFECSVGVIHLPKSIREIEFIKTPFADIKFSNDEINTIRFTQNNLSEIPTYIKNLKNLEHLTVSKNNVSVIPEWITELKLFFLDLGDNDITIIPEFMTKLELDTFYIDTKKIINKEMFECYKEVYHHFGDYYDE